MQLASIMHARKDPRLEVTFPDGTVVRGEGLLRRSENAAWRTFGLYLDQRWRERTKA